MMGIYIKGFKPQDGLYVIKDGMIRKYKGKGGTVRPYELVEVKEPHGRLIDADALLKDDWTKKEESNLISKQDTQKRLCEDCPENAECVGLKYIECRIIADMPSAQPERMRGRWQEITASDCSGYDPVLAGYDDPVVGYVCSVCHEGYEKEVMGKTAWDYCPNCGSYNGGEQSD